MKWIPSPAPISRLWPLLVVLLFALAPVAGQAQIGVSLDPIAMRVSNSKVDTGPYAFLGPNSTSQFFVGVQFKGYYDFPSALPVHAGFDVRDSILHGGHASLNNFLLGVRISGKPTRRGWKPHIEPVLGAGTTAAPNTVLHATKAEYGIYGGVDYETPHHIDVRVFEVGYSSLITASSETLGRGLTNIPAASLISVSAGFVFRFR